MLSKVLFIFIFYSFANLSLQLAQQLARQHRSSIVNLINCALKTSKKWFISTVGAFSRGALRDFEPIPTQLIHLYKFNKISLSRYKDILVWSLKVSGWFLSSSFSDCRLFSQCCSRHSQGDTPSKYRWGWGWGWGESVLQLYKGMTSDLVKKGTAKRERRTLVMVIIFLMVIIKNNNNSHGNKSRIF